MVYAFGSDPALAAAARGSDVRVLELKGRRGLHLPSIYGRLVLGGGHTLNEPQGTLVMWVASLDDYFPAAEWEGMKNSNAFSQYYVLMTDHEALRHVNESSFAWSLERGWHPNMFAKFAPGPWSPGVWTAKRQAVVLAGHWEMRRETWYCLALTWDRPAGRFRIYANGVLVATEDTTFPAPLPSQPCGPILYTGNPTFIYSDAAFYSEALQGETLAAIYREGAAHAEPELEAHLKKTYAGKGLERLDWSPDVGWRETWNLPLTRPEDLLEFTPQGSTRFAKITPEGLRITTPSMEDYYNVPATAVYENQVDLTRIYLWSRRVFEGDLYFEIEFKPLQRGGLALLMLQADGMQREDPLEDYFLRSNGNMVTVYGEDVRNYHWEFYRDMVDTRNDRVSHAVLKNPWRRPIAYQIEDRSWENGRWYRLSFLQQGNRLIGAIDGVKVFDVEDTGFDNNGPVFRHGRIVLRCMMRTDLVFRNIKVLNRANFKEVP
jgi:hypothetical protein